jgi:hypothetical protein
MTKTQEISRRAFMLDLSVAALALPTAFPADVDGDGRVVLQGEARKKRSLGQFFTQGTCWLQPQIIEFIESSKCSVAYDPFAGSGCLFRPVTNAVTGVTRVVGLDIDPSLGWKVNDSLLDVPSIPDAVIVTNPPYISNYSASRKRLGESLRKYFALTPYDDIYLLALDRMLSAQKNVVAIIPETFINSPYRKKNLLHSITVLEQNPFHDTDTPVVVVCFDSKVKPFSSVRVYKDGKFVCTLADIESCRKTPTNDVVMRFNDLNGWLAVRCVDTTNPNDMLRFDFRDRIDYDWDKGIKVSSRLLTLIAIDVPMNKRQTLINECNSILQSLRDRSHDLVLSPFKGNMKNGVRRRRLDFQTCRAIVEEAYKRINGGTAANTVVQPALFGEAI